MRKSCLAHERARKKEYLYISLHRCVQKGLQRGLGVLDDQWDAQSEEEVREARVDLDLAAGSSRMWDLQTLSLDDYADALEGRMLRTVVSILWVRILGQLLLGDRGREHPRLAAEPLTAPFDS